MDLAKVGEVMASVEEKFVNGKLSEGWVLITAKVTEGRVVGHTVLPPSVVYVLGKPRERQELVRDPAHQKWLRNTLEFTARVSAKAGVPFPAGMELEEAEAWLKEHLPFTDPDHPDYQLHAKGNG